MSPYRPQEAKVVNAVLHAEEAIDLEPRFVWAHIALGRGLMIQKKYAEAEQALIKARKYGRFPSLEFEIAAARVGGGFYREAAEDLRGIFTAEDDSIATNLGGRISRNAATLADAPRRSQTPATRSTAKPSRFIPELTLTKTSSGRDRRTFSSIRSCSSQ